MTTVWLYGLHSDSFETIPFEFSHATLEFSAKIGSLSGSTFRFSSNIPAKLGESGGMKSPYRGNARGV